ncbi:MAG: hypothetical protein N838_07950 [Thiohalocapsa sp. PB-PSB1]|nr:MAG: hypothetical protein N838_07950 [Thiohalocapsa sp. PB-PSB1]
MNENANNCGTSDALLAAGAVAPAASRARGPVDVSPNDAADIEP